MAKKQARAINAATALFRAVSGRKDAEIPSRPSARSLIAAIGGAGLDLGGQITKTAKVLGRPVAQVQAWADQDTTVHHRTIGMLDRHAREAGWTPEKPSAKGMLIANFGDGPDGSHINAREAAKRLGVSVSTVRNWAAGRTNPRPANLARLTAVTQRNMASEKFRRQLADRQLAAAKGRGSRVTVSGWQGVVDGKEYFRNTSSMCDLSPEDMRDFMNIYATKGPKAAMQWLTKRWQDEDNGYHVSWEFDNDRMSTIDIGK